MDPNPRKLVKVRLQDGGEDIETPWAEVIREIGDSGEVEGPAGNVPFLHAKPTYEDVIRVRPDPHDGMLTWDRGGVAWEEIGRTIQDDSGRWAMIID